MKRFLSLCLVVLLFLICTGCGDTFRPVIIPNPPKFPDPRAAHTVVAISDNGTGVPGLIVPGSVMVVDVSGDTDVSVADCQAGSPCIGIAPVHAVQQTASQVLVVNQSVPGVLGDSLSKVTFSGTTINGATTISLPADSAPSFVATTESNMAYVALPGFVPPSVAVVSTASNSLVTTIPVGNNPVAIAETPDAKKLYVANNGSGTVSNFNTIDRSPRNPTPIALSSPPLWLAARSDSQRVYVLEPNGSLATLDTTSTGGPDSVTESGVIAPGAKYMVYDGHLNRLYIPSQDPVNGAQLVIVDVSSSQPPPPVTVLIATVPPSSRDAQDPCASTATTALKAISAASLPDGSRAYVGSFYVDGAGNVCPQVTAINTSSNTVKTAAAVPGFPGFAPFSPPICSTTSFRIMMAAGGDSSRVYLSSCDGGNVNIIDTTSDTYLLSLAAPVSSRAPIPPSNQPPPQNPVFLIAGP